MRSPLPQASVSAGSIREAIRRLTAEGLVDERPRRSGIVSGLSREEFLEAYQVREALEMLAVRLACNRLEEEEIALLEKHLDDMKRLAERDNPGAFFEAIARFHQLLVEASGNRKLTETYRQLAGQMGRYQMPSLALRGSLHRSIAELCAIVSALSERDADRAARLISEHHIRVLQRNLEASADSEPLLVKRA